MKKILNKLNRSTRETGKARRNRFLKNSPKAKRTKRKHFALRPPQGSLKSVEPAIKIFCLTNRSLSPLTKAELPNKTPLFLLYFIYNRSRCPYQPFDYPQILIKILPEAKMFIGIGQEFSVLHKSFGLILTLSQKSSLPRVIENSPTGIVDSQERNLTKGGKHAQPKS